MARLVIFVAFILIGASLISLTKFRKNPVDNKYFNYEEAKKEHDEKMATIDLALNPPVVEEKKEEKPKIVELALDTPQLERGHKVYFKAGKCNTCHGKYGEGKTSQKAPRIAGQLEAYLYQQLSNMKAGIRVNAKMNPYLKKLNDQDFKDVAHYMSKLQVWPLK